MEGALGAAPLVFAWSQAALAVAVCDYRVLAMAAYAIVFLVGAPFHWPHLDFWALVGRTVPAEYFSLAGAAIWASAAVHTGARQRTPAPTAGEAKSTVTATALSHRRAELQHEGMNTHKSHRGSS